MTKTTAVAIAQPQPTNSSNNRSHMNGFKYLLPADYVPSEFDFVIGRGRQIKSHAGNQRLFANIRKVSTEYTTGDKARKSLLLSQLVKNVYAESPTGAGFVKKDSTTGRWYAVEDALARSSAAQAVRDCLHHAYKSSRQFKQQRRRAAKVIKQQSSLGDLSVELSSASSSSSSSTSLNEVTDVGSMVNQSFNFKPIISSVPPPPLKIPSRTVTTDFLAPDQPQKKQPKRTSFTLCNDLFSMLSTATVPAGTATTTFTEEEEEDPFKPLSLSSCLNNVLEDLNDIQDDYFNNCSSSSMRRMSLGLGSSLGHTTTTSLYNNDPLMHQQQQQLITIPVNMNPMASIIPEDQDFDSIFD